MRHTAIKTTPMRQRLLDCARAAVFACFATLLSLPASAGITMPPDPLTSGSRIPPNILFILDDSGSMAFHYMPDTVPSLNNIGDSSARLKAYTRNTIYYNPAISYQPWINAAGSLLTGGTSYNAVYGDFNKASGNTIDLGNSSSCQYYNQNDSSDDSARNTQVCGGVQTFYVPKNPASTNASYLADGLNYYRYQILSGGSNIVRSEYGTVVVTSPTTAPGFPQTVSANSGGMQDINPAINIPAGATNLTVTLSGGTKSSGSGADLYVKLGSRPTTSVRDCRSNNSNNNESCSFSNPAAGAWYVGVNRASNYSNVTLTATYTVTNSCTGATSGTEWTNCTSVTPTGRTLANELTNYATWFSYHRTRIKVAKAGASLAFAGLQNEVRVGFRTIWGRTGFDIPVQQNQGLFANVGAITTRSNWYSALQGSIGYNGTPLLPALQRAGEYFRDASQTGPYGPESGTDQYACRQNFTILTTDGFWNSTSGFTSIGNADGTGGTAILRPNGTSYTYAAAAPYQDTISDTLADVAMYYWKNDLRPGTGGLANIVPTSAANPAFWQHMVTFGISIGLKGTLDQGSVESVVSGGGPRKGGVAVSWPDPTDTEDEERIDDLLHAAVNGHGTFVAASNPTEFASGLQAALAAITERTASFSNISTNSTQLDTGTRVFKANYVSGSWIGELSAYPISGTPKTISATASWNASAGIPNYSVRKVYTFNDANNGGTPFPTTNQINALARVSPAVPVVTGLDNAAYIKGDRSREKQNGGTLRNRTQVLGDIVSSSPAYSQDTNTVYVGANDGMLHAFNGANGAELFAYVPGGINVGELGSLSRPDYAHRFFVDGPVVVSTREQTPNQNILVGGLGKGGKGIYALDVTSPGSFVAANVKWEKNSVNAGRNMGLVQGTPIIAKLNNGDTAVIVGNGVNSTDEKAVLFVYNLDTGALLAELNTGAGSVLAPNGLSAPDGLDVDSDGKLDYVYAGDMLGNVWKFDLSSDTPSNWSAGGTPLFIASKPGFPAAVPQPITAGVTLARDPDTFKLWVFFGTGRFMTTGDPTNPAVQSLYGVIDDESGVTVPLTDLQLREFRVAGIDAATSFPVRGFEPTSTLDITKKGWYVDLKDPPYPGGTDVGERIVSDVQVNGNVLVVSSIIPQPDACQSDGRGYINALDAFTGTSVRQGYFDLNRDGNFGETVGSGIDEVAIGSANAGVGLITQALFLRGVLGIHGSDDDREFDIRQRTAARVSWREIVKD